MYEQVNTRQKNEYVIASEKLHWKREGAVEWTEDI